jgi:tRNA-Thr(GGU) m(6)t(6)A37 methyltransferase TsaA
MTLYEFEGRRPRVHETAYVAPSAQVIGDVDIGADCYVGHGAILRGDYGRIEVGAGTAIEEGAIVHARPDDVTVFGARVTLGHGAMVHNATIRADAVIGMRATVSDFSVVEEGALIGEMGLVKQHQVVPAGKVAVGIPVRVVGDVTEKNRDMTVWAKELYVDLAHRYPSGLREIPDEQRADEFVLRPIGVVHTPFERPEEAPIQGTLAPDTEGVVEVKAQFEAGLADVEGFSHVVLLYAFHRSQGYRLRVTPYLDDEERGLFATRAPRRPNPLGLTVVELVRVDGRRLHVKGVDMLDGTPLLDIKPHVGAFDEPKAASVGWLAPRLEAIRKGDLRDPTADGRFHEA